MSCISCGFCSRVLIVFPFFGFVGVIVGITSSSLDEDANIVGGILSRLCLIPLLVLGSSVVFCSFSCDCCCISCCTCASAAANWSWMGFWIGGEIFWVVDVRWGSEGAGILFRGEGGCCVRVSCASAAVSCDCMVFVVIGLASRNRGLSKLKV